MNLRHALIAAAAVLLAASAQAHDCSGGNDGGMDATGNQCNEPARVASGASAPAKVAWLSCLSLAHAAETAGAAWRERGLVAYERGHDAEALAYFRRAAEAGDTQSAEIVALMYRFGPQLYPAGVPADAAEAAKWAAIAAEARRREAGASVAAR